MSPRLLRIRATAAVMAAFLVTLATRTQAKSPVFALRYERATAAAACPDEPALRDAVASRLGYSPFDDSAEGEIRVVMARDAAAWSGTVELRSTRRAPPRLRVLRVEGPDCSELAAAVALAISIAVDPARASQPAEPPPPVVTPAVKVETPATVTVAQTPATQAPLVSPPSPPPDSPAPREPVVWAGRLGPAVSWGTAPSMAAGAQLAVEARRGAASFSAKGRADLPASATVLDGARVRSYLMILSLLACAQSGAAKRLSPAVYGCAMLSGGALEGSASRVQAPQRQATPFFAAGGRLGIRLPVASSWAVDLHGDLVAPLTPTTLRVGDREAWSTAGLSVSAGAAVVVNFR